MSRPTKQQKFPQATMQYLEGMVHVAPFFKFIEENKYKFMSYGLFPEVVMKA